MLLTFLLPASRLAVIALSLGFVVREVALGGCAGVPCAPV